MTKTAHENDVVDVCISEDCVLLLLFVYLVRWVCVVFDIGLLAKHTAYDEQHTEMEMFVVSSLIFIRP